MGVRGCFRLPRFLATRSNWVFARTWISTAAFTLTAVILGFPTNAVCQPCRPPPADLVAWWPGDGNANDIAGNSNGVFENGAGTVPGKVGQAFSFDGADARILVSATEALNVGQADGFTVEAWIFPEGSAGIEAATGRTIGSGPIVEWVEGVHFWQDSGTGPLTGLYANIRSDPYMGANNDNNGHHPMSAQDVITQNAWNHVAVTYSKTSGVGKLYVDGEAVHSEVLGSYTPKTATDLNLGRRPLGSFGGPFLSFNGLIDEVSIYSRALSADEILAIFSADTSGKCKQGVATATPTSTATASPSPTPTCTATPTPAPAVLLGLGDSIAAGHGLGPSDGFPDNASSYPMLLASALGYTGMNYAMSGACAASPNDRGASPDTPADCRKSVLGELRAVPVSVAPNVITLTVGANDILFGKCFEAIFGLRPDNPCDGATFTTNLKALSSNLHLLFMELKVRFPGKPIYAMLYYSPVPGFPSTEEEICPIYRALEVYDKGTTAAVRAFLESKLYNPVLVARQTNIFVESLTILNRLNKTIADSAAAEGVTTVPLLSPFLGHDLCRSLTGDRSASEQWIYGPSLHGYVMLGPLTKPVDFDLPSVCLAPDSEDSTPFFQAGSGKSNEAWNYSFVATINCMPHPTIDGQKGIAAEFMEKMGFIATP